MHVAFFATRVGLTDAQVTSVTHGDSSDACWDDERDRVLLDAVDQLHDTAHVDDVLWARLADVLSEAEQLLLRAHAVPGLAPRDQLHGERCGAWSSRRGAPRFAFGALTSLARATHAPRVRRRRRAARTASSVLGCGASRSRASRARTRRRGASRCSPTPSTARRPRSARSSRPSRSAGSSSAWCRWTISGRQHQRDLRPVPPPRPAPRRRDRRAGRPLPARLRGVELDELTEVISHPQALAQCEEFLSSLGAAARADYDTAGAARRIASEGCERPRPSRRTALRSSTGSPCWPSASRPTPTTPTRFGVIARTGRPARPAGQDLDRLRRRSRPGCLYRCLGAFAERHLNLTKLESRPRPGDRGSTSSTRTSRARRTPP